MNRKQCLEICAAIEDPREIIRLLNKEIKRDPGKVNKTGTWQYYARKMAVWLENMESVPAFSVFSEKGNKKLPFYAFSSLAIADCPGRGACVDYCYSLKGWRYPAAFFRQLQNSLLIRHCPETIAAAWHAIPARRTVRLFVDGDFSSVVTLRFFMDLCKARPDLAVYGYSKSWSEFVTLDRTGYAWPENYLTNASSGSKWHRTGIENAFHALPPVRGEFEAVKVDKLHIKNRAYQDKANKGSREYRAAVQSEMHAAMPGKKIFPCPGNCGNCLPAGKHACGSRDFSGIAIGIGVH